MTNCMRCGEPHEDLEPGCEAMCDRCQEELLGKVRGFSYKRASVCNGPIGVTEVKRTAHNPCAICGTPDYDGNGNIQFVVCDNCAKQLDRSLQSTIMENGRLLDQAFKAPPFPNKCFACGTPMNGVGLCRYCQGMRTGFHTKYFRRKLTALLMEAVDESAKAANKVRSIANQLANLDK